MFGLHEHLIDFIALSLSKRRELEVFRLLFFSFSASTLHSPEPGKCDMSEHPCDSDTETVSAPGSVIIIDSDDNDSQHLEGMCGSVYYFKERSSLALLEKAQFLTPSI